MDLLDAQLFDLTEVASRKLASRRLPPPDDQLRDGYIGPSRIPEPFNRKARLKEKGFSMKNRFNLVLVASLVLATLLVWVGMRDHRISVALSDMARSKATDSAAGQTLKIQVQSLPTPEPAPVPALAASTSQNPTPQSSDPAVPAVAAKPTAAPPEPADSASPSTPSATTQPSVAVGTRELRYNARPGDNVSVLAAALLGSDNAENRNAIIAANPSLQDDPDRVVAGKTYRISIQPGAPMSAAPASPDQSSDAASTPTTQPDEDQLVQAGSDRELRYTAKAGDTVSTLAEALLGSDSKENRDAIVNSNPSLKADPDRIIAGKTYWIPAPAPVAPQP
jgi:hypothetical protein